LIGEYDKKNTQVLGVSFDTVEENAAFAKKFDFPFPLLCDTDRAIGRAYGAAQSSKDEFARRIAYVIGEDGRVIEAHAKVDARSYPHDQLKRL
jgi:peroxiredoxin Q/BCP